MSNSRQPATLFVNQTAALGGAELALLSVVEAAGPNSHVVLFEDGPLKERLENQGVGVTVLSANLRAVATGSGAGEAAGAGPTLWRLIRQVAEIARQYDVIFSNSNKALIVSGFASLISGKPLVARMHDIISAGHFSALNRFVYVQCANAFATVILANSEASARAFAACGGNAAKVKIAYPAVDSEVFCRSYDGLATLRQELAIPPDMPIVGCFSRIAAWKGQDVLLEAARKSQTPFALIFVGAPLFGEESLLAKLQQQASEIIQRHAPEKSRIIRFLGFRKDVAPLMQLCDLIVLPSTEPEPFGRVIVEAQMSGVPVIATDAGGAREIINTGVTGILVPAGDAETLSYQIEICLSNSEESRQLANAARESALERFTLAPMQTIVRDVLGQVTHSSASGLSRLG